MPDDPKHSTPENITVDMPLYDNEGDVDTVARDVLNRHKVHLAAQQEEVNEKRKSFDRLIVEAKQTNALIKSEQAKGQTQQKRDIDTLIQESKERQRNEQRAHSQELGMLHQQIKLLQSQAQKRIHTLAPEQQRAVQLELDRLVKMAFDKHRAFEARHRSSSREEREELSQIVQEIKKNRIALQKAQSQRLKDMLKEFMGIINSQQENLQREFKSLASTQKEDLNLILMSATRRQDEMKRLYTDQLAKNKLFLRENMATHRELMKQGRVAEAKHLHQQIHKHIQDTQVQLIREHRSFTRSLKEDLAKLEASFESTAREVQTRYHNQIRLARATLEQQSRKHAETATQEALAQTKRDLAAFEERVYERRHALKLEHLEAMKLMQTRINNELKDNLRRQTEDQKIAVRQTHTQIMTVGQKNVKEQQHIIKTQVDLNAGAARQISAIDATGIEMQRAILREQANLIQEEQKITDAILSKQNPPPRVPEQKPETKPETKPEVAATRAETPALSKPETGDALDRRLGVAQSARDAHQQLEEKKRKASEKMRQQMLQAGRANQDALRMIDEERQEINALEMERRQEISQRFKQESESAEAEIETLVAAEQERYNDVVQSAQAKEKEVASTRQYLEEITREANENQKNIDEGNVSQDAIKKQDELLRLISAARKQYDDISTANKNVLDQARAVFEANVRDVRADLKNRLRDLQKQHEQDLADLDDYLEERKRNLKMQMQVIEDAKRESIQGKARAAEEEQRRLSLEQKKVAESAQNLIHKLDDEPTASD